MRAVISATFCASCAALSALTPPLASYAAAAAAAASSTSASATAAARRTGAARGYRGGIRLARRSMAAAAPLRRLRHRRRPLGRLGRRRTAGHRSSVNERGRRGAARTQQRGFFQFADVSHVRSVWKRRRARPTCNSRQKTTETVRSCPQPPLPKGRSATRRRRRRLRRTQHVERGVRTH